MVSNTPLLPKVRHYRGGVAKLLGYTLIRCELPLLWKINLPQISSITKAAKDISCDCVERKLLALAYLPSHGFIITHRYTETQPTLDLFAGMSCPTSIMTHGK